MSAPSAAHARQIVRDLGLVDHVEQIAVAAPVMSTATRESIGRLLGGAR